MANLLVSVEHAFASAAAEIVKVARFVQQSVLPVLQKAQASEQMVETITGLVDPAAVNIERLAFAVLGLTIKAVRDAGTAGAAGGMNMQLDAQLIADIKAIMSAVTNHASVTNLATLKP